MARFCHNDHKTIIIKWALFLAGGIMNGWYHMTYTPIKFQNSRITLCNDVYLFIIDNYCPSVCFEFCRHFLRNKSDNLGLGVGD